MGTFSFVTVRERSQLECQWLPIENWVYVVGELVKRERQY